MEALEDVGDQFDTQQVQTASQVRQLCINTMHAWQKEIQEQIKTLQTKFKDVEKESLEMQDLIQQTETLLTSSQKNVLQLMTQVNALTQQK